MAEAADVGIVADDGGVEYHLLQLGIGAYDGVADYGGFHFGVFAYGDVWPYDAVAYSAALGNAYGRDDHGGIERGYFSAGLRIFHLLEEDGVGGEEGLFLTAVEPVIDAECVEFDTAFYHMLEGIGEVVFAILVGGIVEVLFEGGIHGGGLLDVVDAHHCHVALGYEGFLYHAHHGILIIEFRHAKAARVIDLAHAYLGYRAVHDVLYVVVAYGIAQHYDHFIVLDGIFGEPYGMAGAAAVVLGYEGMLEVRVGLVYIALYLLAQVSDDEDEFGNAGFEQLVYNNPEYGFACDRDQCFGLGICKRAQLSASPCHRNNSFHVSGIER